MSTTISIIGCGWLGLPLATHLIHHGYKVKGTTSTPSKRDVLASKGIEPYTIQINEAGITGDIDAVLDKSETLIINIPPGLRRNPNKNHAKEIQNLITKVENHYNIKNVLYVSSTSVFKDETHFPVIENDTNPNGVTTAAQQLISIENYLKAHPQFTTTILRCSGLVGNGRHPGNMLSGRKAIKNGNAPINLIHINDCIAIITLLLQHEIWGVTYNAAYPHHPSKKVYYTAYCKDHNISPPQFDTDTESEGKLIDASKLEQDLQYTFSTKP